MKSNQTRYDLPTPVLDAALIQNPSNPAQILIFGGHDTKLTMIYDVTTNEYQSEFVSLEEIIPSNGIINSINAINGTTDKTIILFGSVTTETYNSDEKTFYAIYNVETQQLEQIGDNGKHYIMADDTNKLCCSMGTRICKYKNYLFSTGGNPIIQEERSKSE